MSPNFESHNTTPILKTQGSRPSRPSSTQDRSRRRSDSAGPRSESGTDNERSSTRSQRTTGRDSSSTANDRRFNARRADARKGRSEDPERGTYRSSEVEQDRGRYRSNRPRTERGFRSESDSSTSDRPSQTPKRRYESDRDRNTSSRPMRHTDSQNESRSSDSRSERRGSESRSERRGSESRSERRNTDSRSERRSSDSRSEKRNTDSRSERRSPYSPSQRGEGYGSKHESREARTAPTKPSRVRSLSKPNSDSHSFVRNLHAQLRDDIDIVRTNPAEPFSTVPYERERSAKAREFEQWWKNSGFDGKVLPFVAAPLPRGYRGTTKRSVHLTRNGVVLDIGDQLEAAEQQHGFYTVVQSDIEPASHFELYCTLAEKLSTTPYHYVCEVMNYIIIRDTGEMAVIFNVAEMSGEVVRKCKALAQLLQESELPVRSVWIYHDASRSSYYLDQREQSESISRIKKIVGFDALQLELAGIRFRVSPFSFSQVNIPMMRELIGVLENIVSKQQHRRLVDLYSGYGLFSHCLSAHFSESIGLDSSSESIVGALELYRRRKKAGHRLGSMNFKECFITAETLKRHVPPADGRDEVIILDPPRQGTAEGVIDAIAARGASLIVHIFCSMDEIPRSIKEWKRNNYHVITAQAFDMFPGTTSIETMVVLEKQR